MTEPAAELRWVFRPRPSRPANILILAGAPVHAFDPADANGNRLIVLRDGARVRAERAEIAPERADHAQRETPGGATGLATDSSRFA
jgi:hypothetical protein